jgi:hypothetical protein
MMSSAPAMPFVAWGGVQHRLGQFLNKSAKPIRAAHDLSNNVLGQVFLSRRVSIAGLDGQSSA